MDNLVTYLDGYCGVTEKIKGAMYRVCKEYLYIGFLLDEVKRYRYFEEHNYIDVYDYAFQELGFKKSSVISFIAIFNTFAAENNGMKTMHLRDEYKNFKYSQLCEMLSLSPSRRNDVTSDMTIRDIRQMKKSDQTSGQTLTPLFSNFSISISLPFSLSDRVNAFVSSSGLSFDIVIANALSLYLDTLSANFQQMG